MVGALVKGVHDCGCLGILVEIGPKETRSDHGDGCGRVVWFDGEETIEFIKMLEIVSENR